MCAAIRGPSEEHVASWVPSPGDFSEHERTALLRQNPLVRTYKKLSVQSFEFIGFDKRRVYDSSAAWVNTGGDSFLCRVWRFFSVAPCCHADCQPVRVAEIQRFRRGRSRAGLNTYSVEDTAPIEHIDVQCLLPQVVMLLTVMSDAPSTSAERQAARHQMLYGPFYVIDVISKRYA